MYRQPTQAEIELLVLRFGEVRADELARTLVCSRCLLATDCCVAFCPDRDSRRLAPSGCLTTPAGMQFAAD